MNGTVQAIGCRVTIEIGPEGFHDLLSSKLPPRATEETAEQYSRSSSLPDSAGDGSPIKAAAALDAELSQ
jgi:hypothetical protein